MKKYISILLILLLASAVVTQEEEPEETPEEEEEAGAIGPEHGFLHALDIVADNIAAFLSRIGGEETHANVVRRIVAERRAEHLRLLRLKKEGEITSQEYSKMVSGLNKQINKKEQELSGKGKGKTGETATGETKSSGKSSGKGRGKSK